MKSKGKSKFLQNHRGEGSVSAENLLTQLLADTVAMEWWKKKQLPEVFYEKRCS